jgi:hypothetical protein
MFSDFSELVAIPEPILGEIFPSAASKPTDNKPVRQQERH